MRACRTFGVLILGLACGCANRAAVPAVTEAPSEGPVAQLRRDNAGLRRRVQMLEDRVLYLEKGRGGNSGAVASGPGAGSARGVDAGTHTLPDGRQLPIVRLTPSGQRAAAAPAQAPSAVEEAEEPERIGEPTEASRSYRLEGTRLVDLTRANGPAAPDRPDRGRAGQAVIAQYDAAMAVYKSGQLERAEAAFTEFARRHSRHDYADNALYWQGEAAYDQHHYADALAAFTAVVERYGGGNKAPDALLKIGLCYRQLGDLPNARDVLDKLIAAYPGERASDIARVKLAEIES